MATAQPAHPPYTPLQQDRQARNRPTYIHQESRPGASRTAAAHQGANRLALARDETFEERERRYKAARILESNEMLIWHAAARNESIPQTRLHFEKIVAGFDSDSSEPEWENDSGANQQTQQQAQRDARDGNNPPTPPSGRKAKAAKRGDNGRKRVARSVGSSE
ncbi:uncharacterized protein K452DRAFT_358993 [Aplosporella prunicola CBS 121167]|uniref:Uncharacterized protein n=1 Tax=Aplosporella prunicola CBS 121167 TaxID=1176127 RepID=A0A6A6BAF4_9PEZI|nr:uncharacterized protein K452DRAFT_358993 [Aplosporella prunicola CBS 121167]KAF2141189.1 hypothetical protein K452DRAFT_358993 [Aplosporella prunicola CBS 121167]